MFTNWLTDSTGLTNTRSSINSTTANRLNENNTHHASAASTKVSTVTPELSLLSGHNLTNLNSNIMSTPPDVILEVGPAPTTVRFMAHGLILGMHSGYLRSAIRFDERGSVGGNANAVSGSSIPDIIVYLTNVTAEQFAPLLTYMYTGYLDLNVENIFGVLLATHVLHMPRALEICRSYLARAQTEGYFAPNNTTALNTNPHSTVSTTISNSGKIIRPIPSKPQLTNFGFLPLGHQPLALKTLTNSNSNTTTLEIETKSQHNLDNENKPEEDDDIEVDEVDKQSMSNDKQQISIADDEEEDVEVFIDSNSETEVVVETQIQKLSFRKVMENKKSYNDKDNKIKHHKKSSSSHHNKTERRKKSSSGLQVAKAPIPASQLDCNEANKVIIDVASCDGPVRFKRILNTAYGHKPDDCSNLNNSANTSASIMPERSLQSVSLSFHQQMAKTISQQQQQQQQQLQHTEESENSETSNGSMIASMRPGEKSSLNNRKTNSEVFVCVYCKHTFKSQYCYQKHAKRHLNPLTLQATCVPDTKANAKDEPTLQAELQITKHQNSNTARAFYNRPSTHSAYSTNAATHNTSTTAVSTDYLRREVRPLDMNVQYYPCKTCGCKFPSYYFVHKHRKMCHAEEEAAQQQSASGGSGDNTSSVVAATTAVASVNVDECLNSQSSD